MMETLLVRYTYGDSDDPMNDTSTVLDKTWQEIHDAVKSGKFVYAISSKYEEDLSNYGSAGVGAITVIKINETEEASKRYQVFFSDENFSRFACGAPSDYPTLWPMIPEQL